MTNELQQYCTAIEEYAKSSFRHCFREAKGKIRHPFIVPGSTYQYELWDWDSWLTDYALSEIADGQDITEYEYGCVLNFLEHQDEEGRIPINITPDKSIFDLVPGKKDNIHKPCLAQHALFLSERTGTAEWLRDTFPSVEKFIGWYENNSRHESGLFFWTNDFAIGVDNDPCTFYRPDGSCGSILLNCLMYKEMLAVSKLAEMLGYVEKASLWAEKAENLKAVIRDKCWDERDGFYYSVDLNLTPVDPDRWLHSGAPRHWNTLLMRVDVWSGFLALWTGIATDEEAERIVEHLTDTRTFWANYGVRSLSRLEKMYLVRKSGNPSCWLGPIWGNVNYLVFEGLLRYGYRDLAKELAEKSVVMFGRDIIKCGEMHEYYDPDTGEGVHNQGFQSWNLLAFNFAKWLETN
ncbi:MAG: glycoside hydrolase family 37 [Firmicutes bacterium]|nr:glycoside hydrolase family 37 [Candidatus Colimorpha enterica]